MKPLCRKHKEEMTHFAGGLRSAPERGLCDDFSFVEYRCPKGCKLTENIEKVWEDSKECVHCGK